MNKRITSGLLFILAIFISASFITNVSAQKDAGASQAAVSTTIVISQVYGGGGANAGTPTYARDYVELKNVSSTPQSLNGLSIYYGSATGQFGSSAGNTFALPNVTLQPGQYFLVEAGPAGTVGAALPVTPDVSTTNLTMSATNGKVALVNGLAPNSCGATATPCTLPNAQIIDVVSYGTANNAEGGAAIAALTNTTAAIRKANGCQDTDNNGNDFDIVENPTPRNTMTAPQVCGAFVPTDAANDYNGDGKSDYVVVRNTGGGVGGQVTWFISTDGTNSTAFPWGISTDRFLMEDYDGDGKDDITVYRPGTAGGSGAFYIFQTSTNTARVESFGLAGDDPEVAGDYDGDGKADPAVYRSGAATGQQSTWYYRGSLNNPGGNITFVPWGQNGDFPAPGDYDGDGKNDFVVQRGENGSSRFWRRFASGATDSVVFGAASDVVVPGDYDGDGKTDIATARSIGGVYNWFILPSSGGAIQYRQFGLTATDFITQGDYDGDGKTDLAVWRPSADATQTFFWVLRSTNGVAQTVEWGQNGDYPVANWNVH